MTQNSSIYWRNPETARRARWMADAEGISVSQFVSKLVDERHDELYPEPPIRATCPTCKAQAEFRFVAYWEDLEPGTKLYRCSDCGTTKTQAAINEWNNGKEPMMIEKKETVVS